MTNGAVGARPTSRDVIQRLQATIESVLQDYSTNAPYALLDFPDHPNVGDTAIWAGEMAYLRNHWGHPPSYVGKHDIDWTELARAVPDGPILLHGGGNFGDVWPAFQLFREAVLEKCPDRTVIQLPQSLQFSDPSALHRAAKVIARHKSFVLLVRDQESLDLARNNFECTVCLCPDMAFCLGSLVRPASPTHSLVVLLRGDKEAASGRDAGAVKIPDDAVIGDWLSEPADTPRVARFRSRLGTLTSFDPRQFKHMARRIRYFDQLSAMRIRRGVALLSQGRQVICDRLHAHIMCTLLDIPQIVMDNNYGKISRFMNTWRADWTGVRRASNLSAALELAVTPTKSPSP